MGNSFGTLFRITTWGESHGGGIGVVIDGCPPNIPISVSDIQQELDRRRPGQSHIVTPRKELDQVEILSGIFDGKTTGTSIGLLVRNKDANPKAYDHLKDVYRPSHADYTYQEKYGTRNWQGGGRASARETIGRVAAGAVAKRVLDHICPIECLSFVTRVHTVSAVVDHETLSYEAIESTPVRCPNPDVSDTMIQLIEQARKDGDSLGGIVECVVKNCPPGLGVPVFDKLKADLAKAMLSIPATMGIEFGSGFDSVSMTGAQHNDAFYMDNKTVRTKTNRSGGIQGGISNGEPIVFRIAFKPTATISTDQETVTTDKKETSLSAKGRHDPCVIPRAVPIVDAMARLVLVDHVLRQRGQVG